MAIGEERRAARAEVRLAGSAEELEESAQEQTASADRRTVLAADRTVLAAERTYAAWVRTGLAALAAGVGARALLDEIADRWLGYGAATLLVLFSAFCFMAAVWRQLFGPPTPPMPDMRRLSAPLLLAFNGFLVLIALVALVGIWTVEI